MTKSIHRVPKEVKADILKRIKEQGVPVVQAAEEHGISPKTIYGWLGKGVEGQPTISELARLKRENQMLLGLVGELTVKLSSAQKKNW